jgi:hypothetical protein
MISQRYHSVQGGLPAKGGQKMPERSAALLLRIRQELKDRLADLAKREHRSLNKQIEFILESFLSDAVDRQPNPRRHKVEQG